CVQTTAECGYRPENLRYAPEQIRHPWQGRRCAAARTPLASPENAEQPQNAPPLGSSVGTLAGPTTCATGRWNRAPVSSENRDSLRLDAIFLLPNCPRRRNCSKGCCDNRDREASRR